MFFYHLINVHFSPQVAEQTIYFPLFAEQSFFTKKTIPPPPPQISNCLPLSNTKISHGFVSESQHYTMYLSHFHGRSVSGRQLIEKYEI